ncbi:MAG: winged helix-turn-helix domain-containing protein [Sphingomonadaceae bacterium]|nr:winged helix-turn-helix domain-containing protein [Sphingomonadaceae bacterium]
MAAEMMINLAEEADFSLGPATVRPSLREVAAGGNAHVVEPRVMQVLVLLASHRGQTVSRDQLVERCWGGVIVGENAIQRCIGLLRKLAEATCAFEIVTLARVGYRLNAREGEASAQQPERLLAVLPFDNLSNDPEYDFFADGVTEEILHAIARRSSVKVIGRTSSFQYRGNDKVIARIGQDLGATHVLDGSVRRSGAILRVAVHLMEVADQTMLWSDRFDGDSDNPFDLQERVANGTVAALHGALEPAYAAQPLTGAAYEAMLKLRRLVHSHAPKKEADIATLFDRISEAAPDNAEALALMANGLAALRWTAKNEGEELRLRTGAQEAAEKALAIDPGCGAAHKALFLLEPPAGRFAACEERLEKAHAASPADSELLWSLYLHYLSVGRLGKSRQMAEEAYRVDPLRPSSVMAYANALFTDNRPRQSLALMHHAVDRWPNDPTVFATSIWTAAVGGEPEFARSLLATNWRERYAPAGVAIMERSLFAVEGILSAAPHLIDRAVERLKADIASGAPQFSLIGLCSFLGMDLDVLYDIVDGASFDHLKQPTGRLSPNDGILHLFLRVNARLRTNPRFVNLCGRLGLIDYWRETEHWPKCTNQLAEVYDFKQVALNWCG